MISPSCTYAAAPGRTSSPSLLLGPLPPLPSKSMSSPSFVDAVRAIAAATSFLGRDLWKPPPLQGAHGSRRLIVADGSGEGRFNAESEFRTSNRQGFSVRVVLRHTRRLASFRSNEGPHRFSKPNPEEKTTQMTLWSMAKSPLMYGGDLQKIDHATYDLITNPILVEINSFSSSNRKASELSHILH
ncbi:hypothetical protein PIB30_039117 [Stylosanthes scabra]|uniref:Uncharacterized protein n=1 Tax=Stylosanthes scabra TaxID=79078 RepID=A0ABU6REL7_9FABA|nr:hypothetical protein [Stylosanthes scabra]